MKQTTYMCPFCLREDEIVVKISLSLHKCPVCKRTFREKDLLGYETTREDYASYWREQQVTKRGIPSYHTIDGIRTKRKDVDKQMENMVQESTDNLMHEIIMVRIYNKSPKKIEKAEMQAVKTEIDKLFDTILGRD